MKKTACILAGLVLATGFIGCGRQTSDITVYMPDGAPALALAALLHADTKEDGVRYRVVAPSTIASRVTFEKQEKNADLCVMPLTAASKLLGRGDKYKMLGALTHGNLYLLSKTHTQALTKDNLSSLIGKTVGVLQMNEVPGLTLKAVLHKRGLNYIELTGTTQAQIDKVNLKPLADAGAVDGSLEYYLLAEPAASVQVKKNAYAFVGNLQQLYGEYEIGKSGYPQAVLVAKSTLIENDAAFISRFLQDVSQAAAWLQTASGATIVAAVQGHLEDAAYRTTLKAETLDAQVMSRCNVRLELAVACKTRVYDFLNELRAVNEAAAALPSETFFWTPQ